ncbi:hypothetical protein [Erythrobacter sanguineus]|nr:hypothetical protein [Erythrobacter sanguineus]
MVHPYALTGKGLNREQNPWDENMQSLKGSIMLWIVWIALAFGTLVLVLSAISSGSQRPKPFRYKITVEVETPQGLLSASAVRQIRFSKTMNGGHLAQVTGEAVALDLPGDQALFALLTGVNGNADHASQMIWHVFRELDQDVIELWPNAPQVDNPRTPNPAPMLVTFEDPNDPVSVKKLELENLEAAFGQGVVLRNITVARTSSPVTNMIGDRLEWLSVYPEPSLKRGHGQRDFSLPATLKHGAFRQGKTK